MAPFSSSRYLLALLMLYLYSKVLTADSNVSFSFKNFGKDSNFTSLLVLYGNARVASDSMSVQITGSGVSSAGRIILKKPINLVDGDLNKMVSFSIYFVFSISRGDGDGLAFVVVPGGFPLNIFDGGSMGMFGEKKTQFLAVEFDTFRDEKYGDVNGNHVGVDVDSLVSVKVSNVSLIHLKLNSGEKLQAWIDYEASSKRIEVRLSKLGENRPVEPLLAYPIDLSKMWKEDVVTVGLSSSSGNSSQMCKLYSMSFRSRTVPHWMHSEPMDPENFVKKGTELKDPKRTDCSFRILAALIFGTGCGALGAFIVLFLWTLFGNKRPVVPEECAVQPKEFEYKKNRPPVVPEEFAVQPKEFFEYKKFNVAVDKTIEDGIK